MMTEFALLIDGQFIETRWYETRPPHLPHKKVEWYPVAREVGEDFDGIVDDAYIIRRLPPVPVKISDRQFFQQLAIMGAITEEEAIDAVRVGGIPPTLAILMNKLSESEIFTAKMLICGATEFNRNHPLTEWMGAAMGYSKRQIDDLFRAAAAL